MTTMAVGTILLGLWVLLHNKYNIIKQKIESLFFLYQICALNSNIKLGVGGIRIVSGLSFMFQLLNKLIGY